jgi:ubiquinone/menaquinone biosynthesis C-methylase UbiE
MASMTTGDTAFTGQIPALYDRHLGPYVFKPYADDLARRLADLGTGSLLETACGTGVVTQALAAALPAEVSLTATDLNQAMIDFARGKAGLERVAFRQADALALPFEDASFDAVVCQYGVMFFPDRVAGYREARRVLKAGGRFVFNVWDRIEANPVSAAVTDALAAVFPADPPRFLARGPHGYHDIDAIKADLGRAGFSEVTAETVALPLSAPSHRDPAIGFCQGSPLRGEIEARRVDGLQAATEAAAAAVARRFGTGPLGATMQAHVIVARL